MVGFRSFILLAFIISCNNLWSQKSYGDSLQSYIDGYVKDHQVVKGDDKKLLHFFPIDEGYRVVADFEKAKDSKWFSMRTSGGRKDINRVYGIIRFTINDTTVQLNLYQSQDLLNVAKLKDYLFLPFTDLTSGVQTYDGGRYIDLRIADIADNRVTIDFNKSYNPYCAYVSGKYDCPIPPKENALPVEIRAGEKIYDKKVK
jgi:uncharacterized protein (DUF1684 family)